MVLKSTNNINTPLNVTCDCGRTVPVPGLVTKGYAQTITLMAKTIEELRSDKKFLQDALGESIKNGAPKTIEPADDNCDVFALTTTQEIAYQSCRLAESKLGTCTDREAYDWLLEEAPQEYDIPGFDTWQRYVRAGRKHHGTQKNTSRKGRTGRSVIKDNEIDSLAEVTSQCKQKAD